MKPKNMPKRMIILKPIMADSKSYLYVAIMTPKVNIII
jgi:pyridoxal/pyridoxine/pyridoxamine kinase